jgi:hypothetical protein
MSSTDRISEDIGWEIARWGAAGGTVSSTVYSVLHRLQRKVSWRISEGKAENLEECYHCARRCRSRGECVFYQHFKVSDFPLWKAQREYGNSAYRELRRLKEAWVPFWETSGDDSSRAPSEQSANQRANEIDLSDGEDSQPEENNSQDCDWNVERKEGNVDKLGTGPLVEHYCRLCDTIGHRTKECEYNLLWVFPANDITNAQLAELRVLVDRRIRKWCDDNIVMDKEKPCSSEQPPRAE